MILAVGGRCVNIRDRPRQLEHAVKRPRAHAKLLASRRRAQQALARFVDLTVFSDVCRPDVGVASECCSAETFQLPLPRGTHLCADDFARLAGSIAGQLLVLDTRHFDALRVSKRSSSGPLMRFW